MSAPDYHYQFEDIVEGPVRVVVYGPALTMPMQHSIVVDDHQLLQRQSAALEPIVADLIDLAMAVHVADRLVRHRGEHIAHRHVSLPMRCPEVFATPAIADRLSEALHGFTGDSWTFDFRQRQKQGRLAELQMRLAEPAKPVEVALWSGGLDALAGLYLRLTQNPRCSVTLCSSTNGNRQIHGFQRHTRDALQAYFPLATIKLEQIAPRVLRNGQPLQGNFVPRTRGFVFLMLGAVVAHLEGQQRLLVFENGVGAINLPFLQSAVRYDQSRAVHPVSLCLMSELVSAVLQRPFQIRNPFLFWTKAQMVKRLLADGADHLVRATITCDRRHRHELIQCGRCSSCLLRRQALAAHGWDDTAYVISQARRDGQPPRPDDGDYFRAMLHQVERLRGCFGAADAWQTLSSTYEDLVEVARWVAEAERMPDEDVQAGLTQLYRQYVAEWDLPGVRARLAQELLTEPELRAIAA